MIPLFVTGHGAVSALGLDAARTIASLRGGLDGLIELPFAGVTEQDLRCVPVRGYAEGLVGADRMAALAARALRECLGALQAQEPREPAVFLGLPAAAGRPGVAAGFELLIKDRLERQLGLPRGTVRTICEGRTSVFTAIKQAEAWLKSGPSACIVGAVDSLLGPADLRDLSRRRLLAEEYDGFFPGESAAFVCLSRRSTTGPLGRKAAALMGVGEAIEAADGSAAAPLVGVGLASAMRRALADAGVSEATLGLCVNSVNGTRAEFEDDAMARIRIMRTSPTTRLEVWHLASYLGETGAAYGALALLWASAALELGVQPATGIVITAVDGQRRSAIVLQPASRDLVESPERAPRVGLSEPTLHALLPITSTSRLDDDPGMRLGASDDCHRRLAEEDFDQLASLIFVRDCHLISDSPWTDIESFERRALAHLDALAWSGDTARQLAQTYLKGESEEAAAATFLLCCSPARGGEIDLLLEASAQSGEHRGRIAGTAALCPRNIAEPFLRRLAEVDGDSLRDALWALTIAQWLTPEWVNQAAQKLGRATPELLVALGGLPGARVTRWPLDWLTSSGSPVPVEAALAGMVIETPSTWFHSFRAEDFVESMPEALAISHLQMKTSVLAALQRQRQSGPTRGSMIALGWSGETDGTPLLLEGLEVDDDEIAGEAARSLARIYGIRPIETVVVADDDDGDGPAPAAEPLPPRKADRLSQNRFQWQEALSALKALPGAAAAPGRLRYGQPWTRGSALQMLLDPRMPCSERSVAIWEHAISHQQPLRVHTRQWVATQRRLLTTPASGVRQGAV